ncbi:hypothetical protein BOX15_Mlig000237g1, partial [Macrostomum lignano]
AMMNKDQQLLLKACGLMSVASALRLLWQGSPIFLAAITLLAAAVAFALADEGQSWERLLRCLISNAEAPPSSVLRRHREAELRRSVESLKSEILEACLASWLRPLSAGPDSPELARTLGEARRAVDCAADGLLARLEACGRPALAARLLRLACRFLAARFRAIDEGEGESGGRLLADCWPDLCSEESAGLLTAAVNTGLTHLLPPQEAACGPLRQLLLHSLCYRLCRPALARAAQLPSCCPLRPPELGDRPAVVFDLPGDCGWDGCAEDGAAGDRWIEAQAAPLGMPVRGSIPSLSALHRTEDPDGPAGRVQGCDNDEGSMSQLFSSASHRRRTKSSSTSGTSGETAHAAVSAEVRLKSSASASVGNISGVEAAAAAHAALRHRPFENIVIVGTEKVIDRKGKAYTLYIIKYLAWYSDVDRSRQQQPPASKSAVSRQRVVKRRYKQFAGLYKDLCAHRGYRDRLQSVRGPDFKSRLVVGEMHETRIARRIGLLTDFLQALIATPEVCTSAELKAFLDYTDDSDPLPASAAVGDSAGGFRPKLERVLSDVADLLPRLFSSGGQLENAAGPPLSSEAKDEQPRQPCVEFEFSLQIPQAAQLIADEERKLAALAADRDRYAPLPPPPLPRSGAADAEVETLHDLEAAAHQLALLLTERYRPTWWPAVLQGPLCRLTALAVARAVHLGSRRLLAPERLRRLLDWLILATRQQQLHAVADELEAPPQPPKPPPPPRLLSLLCRWQLGPDWTGRLADEARQVLGSECDNRRLLAACGFECLLALRLLE